MRAVRTIDGAAAVCDVEPPDPADGVLIDVAASGICGSDLHLLAMNLPTTLGHEYAGTTPDGQAVAIQPLHYCHDCSACRRGQTHLCAIAQASTHGVAADGGMAEQAVVHPDCLVPLPAGLAVENASLVEPLAVAVHAVNGLAPESGSRVLVVGGGPIGLMSVVAAQAAGCQVDIAARHAHQFDAADKLGAGTEVGVKYDAVIEAAGTESALAEAFDRCRKGGTVSIPGVYWSPLTIANPTGWLLKELVVKPAMTYGHHHGERETDTAATMLAGRPEVADALITHRFALDDGAEAFRVAADRASGAIKVVLEP